MTLHDKAVEAAARAIDPEVFEGPPIRLYQTDRDQARREAAAAIRAYLAAMAAAGWKLTPREATPDMAIVGGIAWCDAVPDIATAVDPAASHWSAMHDAAPSPEDTP